uniref:Uncharacterized protein n=1 Tax=Timema cristinae TaxID=61476 RepID=A0A7R9GUQ1_TIMCR|nr:unnamed protein product [Timema cristinae]
MVTVTTAWSQTTTVDQLPSSGVDMNTPASVSLFVIGLLIVKPRPTLTLPGGLLTAASPTPHYQFFSTHLNPIPLNKLHSLTGLNLSLMMPWYNPLTIWNGSLGGDPQHSLTHLPSSQTPNMSHQQKEINHNGSISDAYLQHLGDISAANLIPANSPLPVASNNGEEISRGGLTSQRSQPMQPRSVITTRGGMGGTLDRAGSLYHHGILTSHRNPFLNLKSASQNMIPYSPGARTYFLFPEHSVHYNEVPGGVLGHCTLPAARFLTSENINSDLRNTSEADRERVSYHAPVTYWDHHVVPEASRSYWSPHTTVGTTYPSADVCSNNSGCPHTPVNNNTESSKKLVNTNRSATSLDRGMSRLHLLSLSKLLGLGAGIQGYGTTSSGDGKGLAAYVTRKYSHQVVDYGYGQVPTVNIGSIPSTPPSGSYQQTNYTPSTAVSSPGYQQASSSLSTPPYYQHQPAIYKPPVYTLSSILPTVYHRVHSDYGYDVSKFSLDGSGLQESDKKIGVDAKIGIGKV